MPIHPQDLQNFVAMLGNQLIPEGFEEEYEKWLAMEHRRGSQGPLGALLTPLCRMFNLSPPVTPKAPQNVLWRTVQRDTRVLVTLNGVTKRGMFKGMGPYGEVDVEIEGQTWVQAVKPFQVELDTELYLPPDLKLTPTEKEAMQVFKSDLPEAPTAMVEDELPAFDSQAVDEDEDAPPKMADPEWYEIKPGRSVVAARAGEEPFEAEFVGLGPGDGQLVALVDGEEELLDESYTIIAALSKPKPPAKKKAPKKYPKKAASK